MESTFGHMPFGHLRPTGHLPLTITVDDICHQYLTLTLTLTLNINPNTNYILTNYILTQVILEKGPLNVCVCVCVTISLIT